MPDELPPGGARTAGIGAANAAFVRASAHAVTDRP